MRSFSSETTFHTSLVNMNCYIYPQIGIIAADELTSDDLRRLMELVIVTPTLTYLRRHGHKFDPARMDPETRRRRRVTANNILSIARSALNHAWEEGKIPGVA